jgi:D-glycero-alpha-D-manno-heptose 1-phosphate guanylyltransferase
MAQRSSTPVNVDVIVLAGGKGTRLQSVVADVPKSLAPVGKQTMLDHILDALLIAGFRRIIFSTGYMKELVREHVAKRPFPEDVTVLFSEEQEPLGTGGAIKKAMRHVTSDLVLILNGDTYFPIEYARHIEEHRKHHAEVSLALASRDDVVHSGEVVIGAQNRITAFREKGGVSRAGLINGGVYVFNKDVLAAAGLPDAFSIEKDFFEKYLNDVRMHGFVFPDYFIDIGLPETYRKAQEDFRD